MDRYTKVVLTVIAVALSALAVENGIAPAYAQQGVQKVQLCGVDGSCALVMGQRLYVSSNN